MEKIRFNRYGSSWYFSDYTCYCICYDRLHIDLLDTNQNDDDMSFYLILK